MSAASKLKVFISYSRADAKFADELVAGLEFKEEFEVTIDRHSIIEGEDWKKRLGALIADADTVVFILSPDSAQSPICGWEVEEAHRLSKRILPVLATPLGGIPAPPLLAALNYVRFDEERSFMAGLGALVRSLKTDVDWLREHTRLLTRAMEWDAAQRQANRLLSGNDIVAAKEWLARRPKDAPEATALHLDFLHASERAESERISADRKQIAEMAAAQSQRAAALAERESAVKRLQVWTRRGIAAAAAGALGGSGLGYWGYDAERRVRDEQENTKKAAAAALEQAIAREAMRTDIAGQLMAFAASPGQPSAEGRPDSNSPYTKALIDEFSLDKGVSIQAVLGRANGKFITLLASLKAAGAVGPKHEQRPVISSDLSGDVFLHKHPPNRTLKALSIGIGTAGDIPKLSNPPRDAVAWSETLKRAGFPTAMHVDLTRKDFVEALDKLHRKSNEQAGPQASTPLTSPVGKERSILPQAGASLPNSLCIVTYSGFGFRHRGDNRLVFSDTVNKDADALLETSLSVAELSSYLRAAYAASILILDTDFETEVADPPKPETIPVGEGTR